MLARAPSHIWIEGDRALFGWGVRQRLDPGTGPERYERTRNLGRTHPGLPIFTSFTFDPDASGSVAVAPETVVEIRPGAQRVISGHLPGPVSPSGGPIRTSAAHRDLDTWDIGFDLAMAALDKREVDKVVLSKAMPVQVEGRLEPHLVAQRLFDDQPNAYVFGVEGLVGSSPELLISVSQGALSSISLAGSALPDAPNVLYSPKTIEEHDMAATSVAEALENHVLELRRGPRHEAAFPDIVHLATRFDGRLPEDSSILDVLRDLHPTAAVAGTPTKAAVELIREIETHDRRRYAGPVGWFDSSGDGTFAIAIRCGHLEDGAATLYAGAGLVRGSDRRSEEEEVRTKLLPMLRALDVTS